MSNRQVSERPAKLAWFFSTKGRAGVTRFMAVTFAMVFVIGLVAWGFANLDAATYPLLGALGGAALAKLPFNQGAAACDIDAVINELSTGDIPVVDADGEATTTEAA